jgi:NitT/TauT family transport system permease protein/sulfonate transport system permease protein
VIKPADHRALTQRLIAEGAFVILLIVWWFGARGMPEFVLPGPADVLKAMARFVTDWGTGYHALVSFARVAVSVSIAMVLALALAAAVRAAPIMEGIVERRILTFLNSFPSVGWAILGVVWFKISTPTVLFIQTAIVLPFCLINALAGFRQIDPELDELGLSLTRSPARRFLKVTLPLVAPFLVAGLRVAYGIAWKIALVAELLGAPSGLGYVMLRAQTAADSTTFLATCFAIVLVFVAGERLVIVPLERRFARR